MHTPAVAPDDLFVSPDGNDWWSGRLGEPNEERSDGPLATLAGAQRVLRERRGCRRQHREPEVGYTAALACRPCTVWLRGGRYELSEPLCFDSRDSAPVCFRAWPGETPCLDGGREITGWEETEVHGVSAWKVDLPEVRRGEWNFTQLWVNGVRAFRPRRPDTGYYWLDQATPGLERGWGQAGTDRFVTRPGDFQPFHNLTDVEAVMLHFWIEERMPVESWDEARREVVSTHCSRAPLTWEFGKQPAPYYIDNVFEALRKPGQWYLDRPAGTLYYIPRPGETPDTAAVCAPRLQQLLRLCGNPDGNDPVQWLCFQGITFEHTDSARPDETGKTDTPRHEKPAAPRKPIAAASQAACQIPGVLYMEYARHCAFHACTFRHLGWYGLELGSGCTHIDISRNEVCDTGAGGIKIGGGAYGDPDSQYTGFIRVSDNHVHHGGLVYHSGTGIQVRHAGNCLLAHNHVHHFHYSAFSVGWTWGFQPTVSHNNIIEYNLIHDLGQGVLSDMGGIYLLGEAPGTVVRNNVIHTIESAEYGGWGIYPDEGSSHVVIENNISYDANCCPFNQHYGRENIVRNNIFAFGGEAVLSLGKSQGVPAFTLERNIFLTDGAPLFDHGYAHKFSQSPDALISDLNLFWDLQGTPVMVKERTRIDGERHDGIFDFSDWQELGLDRHSVVADPKFCDPANRDFTLAADSPALALGFRPIDTSTVGVRPERE